MNNTRLLLAVFCFLAVAPGSLYAQERQNVISVDLFLPVMSPVSHLSGEDMAFVPLNVKYQRVLTEHQVLSLKIGLTYSWDSNDERILEVNPMLALEWHPFGIGLKGFYLGPSLFFTHSDNSYSRTTTEDDLDYGYWAAVGGILGYEFVLQSRMVIDLVFGLGYGYSKEVYVNGVVASGFQVDETIGGVFVGYLF